MQETGNAEHDNKLALLSDLRVKTPLARLPIISKKLDGLRDDETAVKDLIQINGEQPTVFHLLRAHKTGILKIPYSKLQKLILNARLSELYPENQSAWQKALTLITDVPPLSGDNTKVYTPSRYKEEFSEIGQKLGEGGYGVVVKAIRHLDNQVYAIKKIYFRASDEKSRANLEKIIREVRALARVDDVNVCRYYNAWIENLAADDIPNIRPKESFASFSESQSKSGNDTLIHASDLPICSLMAQLTETYPDEKCIAYQKGTCERPSHVLLDECDNELPRTTLDSDSSNPWRPLRPIDLESQSDDELSSSPPHREADADEIRRSLSSGHLEEIGKRKKHQRSIIDEESGDPLFEEEEQLTGDQDEFSTTAEDSADNDILALAPPCLLTPQKKAESIKPKTRRNKKKQKKNKKKKRCVFDRKFTHTLYIQMQCYEDFTLQHWLEQKRTVDRNENVHIFKQIVQGLKHVHERGLIHRDLKPANIFFSGGVIKIGDFGLAKVLDPIDSDSSSDSDSPPSSPVLPGARQQPRYPQTSTQLYSPPSSSDSDPSPLPDRIKSALVRNSSLHTSRLGTMSYAAPEQLTARAGKFAVYTEKVDIYPLGIILFEMYHPFATNMERLLLLEDLRNGKFPATFESLYPEESNLIRRIMSRVDTDRPSAAEILDCLLFEQNRHQQIVLNQLAVSQEQLEQQQKLIDEQQERIQQLERELALMKERQVMG